MAGRVYWGSGSAPAWRVLATLEEKKLAYESKLIEFSSGGHKSPEILALNPRGQVPTFKDGDVCVNESLAALFYLEKAYPEHPLMPQDKAGYGLVMQRVLESNNIFSNFREVAIPMMRGLVKTDEDRKAWLEKVEAAKKELGYWEGYFEKSEFAAGSSFSLADLALAPFLLALQRFGASYQAFPKLQAYVARMTEWPSLAKTSPPHWKTTDRLSHLEGHL